MRVPRISDGQIDLLATRLAAIGLGRRDFLKVAAGLATMSAAGFNARPVSAAPKLAPGEKLAKEQHLRYGGGSWYEQDPASHDYNKDLYCGGTQQLWAGLMKFNVNFEAVPYVAEKVTPNKDGSVWTFAIRKDSKWSDGSPCSARDFEYSFKRQLDPASAAPYASFLYDIKNAEAFNKKQMTEAKEVGVRAKDDWTLEVTLEGPRGYFPVLSAYSAALPGHRGSIEKHGDKWTEAANIVCNGPFVLDAWEHNKVIILKKNKHFFGAKDVTLEKVTIPIIPIASGALPYENNEIDMTRLQTADLKRFQSDPRTAKEVFRFPYPGTWYLLPQVSKPLAEAVQSVLLENLNMKTELEVLEQRVFRERLWKQDLQFVWIRWFMDYPDPHNEYFDTFYGKKTTGKRQAWSNDAFDKELEAGRDTSDSKKRLAHYAKAEEILQDDVGYVPVAWVVRYAAVKPTVRGLEKNRQSEVVVDGNIYTDMLMHIYMVEKG